MLIRLLFAFLLGAIGILAYSPFDIWLIAFLSALGLVWVTTLSSRKTALWGSFVWSLGYFSVGVNWVQVSMTQFGGVPEWASFAIVVLLAAYLSLYNLLFTYLTQRFQFKNPFALAGLFTFTEYLRGVVFTGFPWLQFGYSLIDSPFANLAPVLGVEGLTFLVMATSATLVHIGRSFAKKSTFPTAYTVTVGGFLLLALGLQWQRFVERDESQKPLTVSLVQGNVEQKMKWDPAHFEYSMQHYNQLVEPLLGKSELVILPESAIAATEENIVPLLHHWHVLGQEMGSELIVGTLYQNRNEQLFNSAVRLGNAQQPYQLHQSPRYVKHHLVPFGEYVPFGELLAWLREVFILPVNLSQGNFIQPALQAAGNRFNLAICYEIIFSDQLQKNQKMNQSDYLLTISNDAWFGESVGPWQHFQIARMRALELGKPLLRATNTGITAIVNERGKIQSQLPQFEAAVLTDTIYPTQGQTPFSVYGNLVIYIMSLLGIALHFRPRKIQ